MTCISDLPLQPIGKRCRLVPLLSHVAEHRQERHGLQQAWHAGNFPRLSVQSCQTTCILREELDRGRKADGIALSECLFAELSPVEIRYRARANMIEMQVMWLS